MDLSEKLTWVNDLMVKRKEEWVKHNPDNTDIPIYVHVWRGDEMVAALQCPLDRDTGLNAVQVSARGFDASTVALTFESYHSTLGESPVTGEHWRPHEMQYVFETDPLSAEKGWVAECLSTIIHDRGGGYGILSTAYMIDVGDLLWLNDDDWSGELRITSDQEGAAGSGVMFQALKQAMAGKTVMEEMRDRIAAQDPATTFVWDTLADDEERIFHMDMATLKILTNAKLITGASMAAPAGSKRAKLLGERMEHEKFLTDLIINP